MKKLVGKVLVLAAAVSTLSLAAFAQNFVRQTGVVNRNVERLTLLPGPNLLSPARNTPSMAPAHLKLGEAPVQFFAPSGAVFLSHGSPAHFPLIGGTPNGKSTIRAVPGNRENPASGDNILRFDYRLENPKPEFRWQFERGTKRM
jgi:hypothetical protein